MSSSGPVPAVIVLEEGGAWSQSPALPEASACPLVIRQNAGETPADFSTRVARELDRSSGKGAVEMAVVACGERSDAAALTARRNMSTAILSFMARRGLGVLLLAENAPGSQGQIAALAEDLDAEWEDLGLRVTVRPSQSSRVSQGSSAESRVA